MTILTSIRTLCALVAIVSFVACSGVGPSSIAPQPASPKSGSAFHTGRYPNIFSSFGSLNSSNGTGHHTLSHFSCPETGAIVYVSDFNNNLVDVYYGRFAGQAPCSQITSGINFPTGLYVNPRTHDLYVATSKGHDVLVFHRGQTTAYNIYADPTRRQKVIDVTLASDGTVIASNVNRAGGPEMGSISTWIGGPHGGKFVGNFPMTNDAEGGFITAQKNGTVYYNDIDRTTGAGALWRMSCPAGVCGAQTRVAGVSFLFPGGLGSNGTNDLLAVDQTGHSLATYELPNPVPKTIPLDGYPIAMAIDLLSHRLFITDADNNDAAEYLYPSGVLVGTVPGNPGGFLDGVAVDP
jgi:hypothetical protein